ncbi:uncharacterized protein LOC100521600 isoform X1 [Sus scrofa]|uniref:uncharacterized protein LOC100521600 isoform X1 n=1 Tax=Sus scrofa TaxID=9823 RepID=UPI000A2B3CDD|nr:uncharacterized protein LOC100521600 isoform X1 [Sus scrofa]
MIHRVVPDLAHAPLWPTLWFGYPDQTSPLFFFFCTFTNSFSFIWIFFSLENPTVLLNSTPIISSLKRRCVFSWRWPVSYCRELNSYSIPFLGADVSVVKQTQRYLRENLEQSPVQYAAYVTMGGVTSIIKTMFAGLFFIILCEVWHWKATSCKVPMALFLFGYFSKQGPTQKQVEWGTHTSFLSSSNLGSILQTKHGSIQKKHTTMLWRPVGVRRPKRRPQPGKMRRRKARPITRWRRRPQQVEITRRSPQPATGPSKKPRLPPRWMGWMMKAQPSMMLWRPAGVRRPRLRPWLGQMRRRRGRELRRCRRRLPALTRQKRRRAHPLKMTRSPQPATWLSRTTSLSPRWTGWTMKAAVQRKLGFFSNAETISEASEMSRVVIIVLCRSLCWFCFFSKIGFY